MKKRFAFVLSVGLFLFTSSCSKDSLSPSFSDIYEHGLGLTEEQFTDRYTQLDSSSTEITEKNGFIIWKFSEQNNLLSGYPAEVIASFWNGKLDSFKYNVIFSDYESAYPALITIASDVITYFGDPSPNWVDEQPLNRFKKYDDFLFEVIRGIEDENIYTEGNHWLLSEENDEHDYRVDLGVQAFENGTVYVALSIYDWKGFSIYNSYLYD